MRSHPIHYTPDTNERMWVPLPTVKAVFRGRHGLDGAPRADASFRPLLDTRPIVDPS